MFPGLLRRSLPFLVILLLIVITVIGQRFTQDFQYERSLILNGEYWRIFTCHFTHTGWKHLFLNLAGAMLVCSLFFRLYSPLCWLIGALCCTTSISLSLLLFSPSLDWYVGLSGLLHGLLLMGIIGEIIKGNRVYHFALLAIAAKLVVEYFAISHQNSSQFIEANIIASAHLSGAITGGLMACGIFYIKDKMECVAPFSLDEVDL